MYTRIAPLLPFIEQFITGWSAWSAWSNCAAECGKSKKYRARVCETYSEGAQCEGNAVEYVECRQARCPTWTEWTQWTQCAPSCGEGMRQRTRQCSAGDAPIELRSKYCTGPEVEEEQCSGEPCKPYWNYSDWKKCNCDSINTTREKYCTKLLNKHSELQILPDSECAGLQHEPLERKCSGPENPETCKALITGGIKGGRTNEDAVFTPNELKKDENFEISNPVKLFGHNMAIMNDRVFLFGGRSVSSSLNENFSELKAWRGQNDRIILQWENMKGFELGQYKRYYAAHSVNTDDNTILMCGGQNNVNGIYDASMVKNCLLFSLETGWKVVTELSEVIVSPTMVWHSGTKHHYLIGGEKDPKLNSIALNDVRRYRDGKWSEFTRLPNRVVGAQSIVINNRIYVFGGDKQGTIYSIDPETERGWRFETRMGSTRSNFPIVQIGPRVWMFGSNTEEKSNIERFDLLADYSHPSYTLPSYARASWMLFTDGAAAILLPQSFLNPTLIRAQPADINRRIHSRKYDMDERKKRKLNSKRKNRQRYEKNR